MSEDEKPKKKSKKYELVKAGAEGAGIVKVEPIIEVIPPENPDTAPGIRDNPDIDVRHYLSYLKCNLTDPEKVSTASAIANLMVELSRKKDELDSIKKQFNGDISKLEAEMNAKANLVRDGYEFRNVRVQEMKDYKHETILVVRTDTNEIITDRRMNNEEMQRPLPGMRG